MTQVYTYCKIEARMVFPSECLQTVTKYFDTILFFNQGYPEDAEKLSKDDVQKMQWEVLEAKIGNWIHFMRIAVSCDWSSEA